MTMSDDCSLYTFGQKIWGKVPIELLGGTREDISVDIKALPSKSPIGYLDLEGVPVTFAAHNIVSGFNGGYVMKPGIDYDEIKTFFVPRGVTYVIRCRDGSLRR